VTQRNARDGVPYTSLAPILKRILMDRTGGKLDRLQELSGGIALSQLVTGEPE
jgi:hypothetical protein